MNLLMCILDIASAILSIVTIVIILSTWKNTPTVIDEAEDATYA